MKKIVFTGGPSAGKTSLIKRLKEVYNEEPSLFFAPEIASMLLANGFPRCAYKENLIFQQQAIFHTQMQMENLIDKERSFQIAFFDRGLMDALAYVNNNNEIHASSQDLLNRYDKIFHLEVAPPFKYTNQNNKARTESYEEALKLENRLKELWGAHPNYNFISAEQTFDEKFEKIYSQHIKPLV